MPKQTPKTSKKPMPKKSPLAPKSFPKMPAKAIREMKQIGKCPSPVSLYNKEIIETVKRLYRDDIEIYTSKFSAKNLLFS